MVNSALESIAIDSIVLTHCGEPTFSTLTYSKGTCMWIVYKKVIIRTFNDSSANEGLGNCEQERFFLVERV